MLPSSSSSSCRECRSAVGELLFKAVLIMFVKMVAAAAVETSHRTSKPVSCRSAECWLCGRSSLVMVGGVGGCKGTANSGARVVLLACCPRSETVLFTFNKLLVELVLYTTGSGVTRAGQWHSARAHDTGTVRGASKNPWAHGACSQAHQAQLWRNWRKVISAFYSGKHIVKHQALA